MAAAAVGALISGVAFYAVGTRAAQDNPFAEMPALVQPAAAPVLVSQAPVPRRTVSRTAEPAEERVVVRERTSPRRSWTKTALVVGGSAASGAGVGGIVGGKKGALIGAAIGGGAASIYEATRR
jgi:hypothetical protein